MHPAGPPAAPLRVTLLPAATAAALAPLRLRPGQQVVADVLAVDVASGRSVLSLGGRRVEAQSPPEHAGLQPGTVVRLVVTEAGAERIVLRLAEPTGVPPGNSVAPAASRAAGGLPAAAIDAGTVLREMGLPDAPDLRAAVAATLERGLPLSRAGLLAVRAAAGGQAGPLGENARAAVYLQARGVPLTARSLELARAAIAQPAPLGDLVRELMRRAAAQIGRDAAASDAVDAAGAPPLEAAGPDGGGPGQPDRSSARTAPGAAGAPGSAGGGNRSSAAAALGAGGAADQAPGGLSLQQLVARSADPAELRRVVELFAESPEAGLARRASPGEGAPPAVKPDARTLLAPLIGDDVRGLQAPASGAAGPGEPAGAAGPGAAGGRPSAGEGGRSARTPGAELPPGGQPSDRSPVVSAAAPLDAPAVPRAVQLLARALHDRIELQQLVNAAAGSAASVAEPAGGGGPAGPDTVAGPAGSAALGRGAAGAATPGAVAAGMAQLALSLPLALGGQLATLELTVQRERQFRRPGEAPGEAPARASFVLRLEHLGEVGADLRLGGAGLRCRLRAAPGPTQVALAAAVADLRTRLEGAGFTVESLDCLPLEPPAVAPGAAALRHVALDL